jgi:phosphatidylserine/phosphatidylglycerophosphate/cardiolipin synthase-like enzyme
MSCVTLRLVEELIGFLRDDKVQVRLYERGFLHAKASLFHRDRIGSHNQSDRLRPFAAVVGSSNFTGASQERDFDGVEIGHGILETRRRCVKPGGRVSKPVV